LRPPRHESAGDRERQQHGVAEKEEHDRAHASAPRSRKSRPLPTANPKFQRIDRFFAEG
jgi:hypothetical protein